MVSHQVPLSILDIVKNLLESEMLGEAKTMLSEFLFDAEAVNTFMEILVSDASSHNYVVKQVKVEQPNVYVLKIIIFEQYLMLCKCDALSGMFSFEPTTKKEVSKFIMSI